MHINTVQTDLIPTSLENNLNPTSINIVSVRTWHNRLGHLSFRQLNVLKPQLQYDDSQSNQSKIPYVCPLAKHRRFPFLSNNHMSSSPSDLTHCDIWWPYNVSTYFLYR